jgi:hypothetical protein
MLEMYNECVMSKDWCEMILMYLYRGLGNEGEEVEEEQDELMKGNKEP